MKALVYKGPGSLSVEITLNSKTFSTRMRLSEGAITHLSRRDQSEGSLARSAGKKAKKPVQSRRDG